MPYLDESFKDEIEEVTECEHATQYFASLGHEHFAGAVNYWNFKIVRKRFAACKPWRRYWQFALWVGTMVCCILEVYRRLVVPYEEDKIKENGDV